MTLERSYAGFIKGFLREGLLSLLRGIPARCFCGALVSPSCVAVYGKGVAFVQHALQKLIGQQTFFFRQV